MGYATHLLGDRDRASDVVQDTFVRLCRQPRNEVESRVNAWLFRVCRNRALDVLKKEGRMKTMSDRAVATHAANQSNQDSNPQAIALQREQADKAGSLLSNLPENQREVIRLKVQGDLTYREISELTGLSISNVGYLLHTGLKAIRTNLAAIE
jgi:RNA polymerase sigma-70 factor (ECF subfamily)